jgi:hypothetical protein
VIPDPHETNPPLPETAVAALYKGNKIEAIRIVRQARGIGLKEAKEAVEDYILTQPVLQRRMAEIDAGRRKGCLPWIFIAAAIGAAVYYFLGKG